MRPAVVALPGGRVGKPEVGAEVDHAGRGGQLGRDRCRLSVRQGEENEVRCGQRGRVGGTEGRTGERREVRMHGGDRLPSVAARGDRAELEIGVPEDQAQQLAPAYPLAPATATV